MKQSRVLYTGFKKANARNISCTFLLLERLNKKNRFLFTNDFDYIDREVDEILDGNWDKIIMFGQKPVIKSIRVEKCAKSCGEVLYTNWNLSHIEEIMNEEHIDFKFSVNSGSSYCNHAYYRMLKGIKMRELDTKVVFIHIPYVDNFRQMSLLVNVLQNDKLF